MSPLRSTWLVAQREIVVRSRSRAYRLSTAFIVIVIVAGVAGLPRLEGLFDAESEFRVGITGEDAEALAGPIQDTGARLLVTVTTEVFATEAAAIEALENGDVDAVLVGTESLQFTGTVDDELRLVISEAVRLVRLPAQLDELGLSFEELQPILEPEPVPVTVLDEDDEADAAGLAIAGISAILLFISIMTYGQWVLHGVIEEKSSRVVEVLLSTVRPYQLLAGKIIGILVLGIGQLALVLAAGGLATMATSDFDLPAVATIGVLAAALWFVLGLVLYGVVFGVAGALVSRQEEASNITLPITSVLTGGYLAAIILIQSDPGGPEARAISMFPFTAPVSMPSRVAMGEAAAWEFAVAVAVMVATIGLAIAIGGRVYAGAILRVGPRIALRDAWRSRG